MLSFEIKRAKMNSDNSDSEVDVYLPPEAAGTSFFGNCRKKSVLSHGNFSPSSGTNNYSVSLNDSDDVLFKQSPRFSIIPTFTLSEFFPFSWGSLFISARTRSSI